MVTPIRFDQANRFESDYVTSSDSHVTMISEHFSNRIRVANDTRLPSSLLDMSVRCRWLYMFPYSVSKFTVCHRKEQRVVSWEDLVNSTSNGLRLVMAAIATMLIRSHQLQRSLPKRLKSPSTPCVSFSLILHSSLHIDHVYWSFIIISEHRLSYEGSNAG